MEKKEISPLLLSENLHAFSLTIDKAQSHFPEIKNLAEKLKAIGFDLDQARWTDLLTNGISNLQKEYEAGLSESLSKAGLNTPHVMNTLFPKVSQFDEIAEILAKLRSSCNTTEFQHNRGVMPTDLHWISIVDGHPTITPETQEEIKEHFRTYISTPDEHALYEQLATLQDAYNAVAGNLKKIGYPVHLHFSLGNLSNFLTEEEDQSVKVRPDGISWALQLAARYRNRR